MGDKADLLQGPLDLLILKTLLLQPTAAGRREYAKERANWRLFAGAVEQLLRAT